MKKEQIKVLIYPDFVCIDCGKQVLFYDGKYYTISNEVPAFDKFKDALDLFQEKINIKLSQKIIKDFKDTVKKEYKIKTGGLK